MDSTKVFLLVALAVAIMSVPIAYMVGQQSATDQVKELIREELPGLRAAEPAPVAEVPMDAEEAAMPPSDPAEVVHAADEEETETAVDTEMPVSVDSYRQLKPGMTYEEVVGVLGRPGTQTMSMVDRAGTRTVSFEWSWDDGFQLPGRVTISFVDAKLSEHSYHTR